MAIHRPVGPSGPFRGWKGRRAGRKEGKRPLKKKQKRDGDLSEVCPPGEERESQDGGTGRDGTGLVEGGGAAGRFHSSGHRHKTSFFYVKRARKGKERTVEPCIILFLFF